MHTQDSPPRHGAAPGEQDREPLESGAGTPPDIGMEHGFALAVHQALRDFHRPDHLRDNPLLGSQLVATARVQSPTTPPTQALRELIRSHCERLGQNAKSSRFQLVLQHTYLAPLRSQQAAAEALHLSWSTYRRCLADAARMLTASLWETEIALGPALAHRRGLHRAWPWFATAALIVLGAAVGAGYLHHLRRRQQATAEKVLPVTLAVLPFLDLDQDSGSRYLSDGISDELITRLGRIPALRVVARTSSFSLRDKPMDVRDIGRVLGVHDVIEGSVQRSADTLRISVALVNTANGYELWSDELTTPRSKIFEAEDAIADAVIAQLHLPADVSNAAHVDGYPTVNSEARDTYLVGMEYLNYRTVPDIKQAINYFQKSIQEDSNYADSWAGLAMAYTIWRDYTGDEPPDTHYQDALAAVKRAIALDPSSASAHAILGLLYEQHWEWPQTKHELQLALQLDPSDATAHQWYAIYFWFTGDAQKALKELRLAKTLDPLSPIINADMGRALSYAGEPQQAAAQFRTCVALAPRFGLTYTFMAENDIAIGEYQQAVDDAGMAGNLWGNPGESYLLMEESVAYAGLGQRNLARQELTELQQRASQHYLSGVMLSWPSWNLGEKDQAFAQLKRAVHDHDQFLMLVFGPDWASMRADPRFAGIRKLMNLPLTTNLH